MTKNINNLTSKDKSLYKQMYLFLNQYNLDSVEIKNGEFEIVLNKLYKTKEEYNIIKRYRTLVETKATIYKFNPPYDPVVERVTSYKNYKEEE